MTREELIEYISSQYNADAEYPWMTSPKNAVFRHIGNKKWFAIIMDIPRSKLGLDSDEEISIANFKCDTILISTLIQENGIYPAYHMNKEHWITVALDGSCSDEKIKWLLDRSFELTAPKVKGKNKQASK